MSKRIAKIKYKHPVVEIHSEENRGTSIKESVLKCTEDPHPDFRTIFDSLIPHVYRILELPADAWPAAVKVNSVSFSKSESTEVEGAVISGTVALADCDAPFCFNTPHLPFCSYSEGGGGAMMDPETVGVLERLRTEADLYLNDGKRAQLDLIKS